MDPAVEQKPAAWQPLTAKGVAVFARASVGRLLVVQLIVAALSAATVVWFLQTTWFPTIRASINQLPDGGDIVGGKLNWTGTSPDRLAESRYLALAVDLQHNGGDRSAPQA